MNDAPVTLESVLMGVPPRDDALLSAVQQLTTGMFSERLRCEGRMWSARDTVSRLRRELAVAETDVETAERDWAEAQGQLTLLWDHFVELQGRRATRMADAPPQLVAQVDPPVG